MPDAPLRIVIYGDFRHDRLGASYRRAFEQLGHHVVPFDCLQVRTCLAPWLTWRLGHRLTLSNLQLRELGSVQWNRHFSGTVMAEHPDLVLIVKGSFVMPGTLQHLRREGFRVFMFQPDNPLPGQPAHRPEFLPCARKSDAYFVWSRSLARALETRGVPGARYLAFAWDPVLFPYQEKPEESVHDVVFVGGWDRDREQILDPVARTFSLKIWGPDYWDTRPAPDSPVRKCWQGGEVRGTAAARMTVQAKVVLNVLRRQNLPDGTNMRTFEIPGCGGLGLANRTSGATEILPEGEAGLYFDDVDECLTQIDRMLSAHRERRRMAKRAHEIVSREHRYVDRAQEIVRVFREGNRE